MVQLRTYWFLIGLVGVITLAWCLSGVAAPGGILQALPFKTICIVGIFLISGLSLPTRQLAAALGHWRLHVFIQGFSFAVVPLCFLALDQALARLGLDAVQRQGLLVLACLPTTVTSCVAMTRMAHGNEAGAICNATLGNLLGVFVTPLIIYLVLDRYGALPYVSVVRKLGLLVLLPVLAGQAARLKAVAVLNRHRKRLGLLSQILLLCLLFLIFSKSFQQGLSVSLGTLVAVMAIAVGAHCALLALSWIGSVASFWGFARADRVAALICSTQKTVALGIPMITILYEGDPRAGLLALPLLCYHPLQLLVDGVVASMLAARAGGHPVQETKQGQV